MRAWILHGPRDLRLEEQSLDGEHLAADELWVRTDASALSTGTDRGNYEGAELVPGANDYPRTVGYSNAGTVLKTGSQVTHFAPGDRVFTLKPHQSEFICQESDMVVRIPESVSAESAAMTYLYHLGFHALRTGGLTPGESVAVVGTGVLGLTTITLARIFGARVVALGNAANRLELAQKVGAHRTWFSNDPDLPGKLNDLTDGIGIDLVVLAANPWDAYRTAAESVRPAGRISVLSLPGRGEAELTFNPLALKWLYGKSLTIIGMGSLPGYAYPLMDGTRRFSIQRGCQYLLHLMEEGTIRPQDLITHRLPYDQAPLAYEMAYNRDKSMVGTIFEWTQGR